MQSLKNGSRLGDYAIIRLIARGGMGEVYEAHEIKLDRRVALKVVSQNNKGDHDDADLIRRFMQEARTLAKVNHPNIVTIHAIDNSSASQYIAMEFVDGVSLKEFLDEYSMPTEIALFLFEQILSGIKRLHEHNIIHRDLKPSNILIRADGQIKILDFGIAKSFDGHVNTNPGVAVGTPPYMAPELRSFKPASNRSDFWSLGAIFFECLTGKLLVLFLEGNEFKFSKTDLKQIPEDMRAIIGSMSAPTPEDRYGNSNEIIDDIQRFRESKGPPSPSMLATFRDQLKHLTESKRPKGEAIMPPPVVPVFDIEYSSGSERMESSIRKMVHTPGIPKAATPIPESRSSKRRRKAKQTYAGITLALAMLIGVYFSTKPKPVPAPPVARTTSTPVEAAAPQRSGRVQLREPADRQLLWLEPAQNPTLAWSRVLNASEYDLQIALDPDFKKIIVNEPVNGNSFIPSKIMPEGVYYWRLTPPGNGRSGALKAHNFTLARLEPVVLVKPLAGQVIETASGAGSTADFEWACRAGARLYNVQVAADADFRKIITSKVVSECRWNNVKLGGGQYHWRVRLEIGPGFREIWSSARGLTIAGPATQPEKTERPERVVELGVPQIKNSKQTQILVVSGRQRTPASVEKLIDLAWKPVKNAHHYLVQISRTKDFNDLIIEENSGKAVFKWKATVPGQVYWRVRASSQAGATGRASAVGQVTVLVPPPVLKTNFKFTVTPENPDAAHFLVDWRPVPLAAGYLVQFGARRDLAGAKEDAKAEPSFEVAANPGYYYMRVAAVNAEGATISPFSNLAAVSVLQEVAFDPPRVQSPAMGAQAPSKNGRISIEFSWSPVPAAESYVLEVSNDAAFADVVERANSGEPRSLLEQAELRGRVYWRVKALGGGKSSQWSESSYFDVK